MKIIHAADLFCGAGGTSTGLYQAADKLGLGVNLLAVNHWNIAIATHSANHLEAVHKCETLDGVDPRKVVPGGHLRLLVASPECTHHSNARGGKPMSDQSRASAWHVLRWMEALKIDDVLIENVREFRTWGPLGANGRPLKSRKGETYKALLNAMRSLGYTVEDRILNAADYGDPTTRERLFIRARRGRKKIIWPRQTHSRDGASDLFGTTKKWRAAREIIDWNLQGQSIFNRKKPLSPNTMRRIAAGLRKFSGIDLEPFLVKMYGTSDAASVDSPAPTVSAQGGHLAVAQPFILPKRGRYGNNKPRPVDAPFQTVVPHHGAGGLVQPFVIPQQSKGFARSTDKPLPTIAGKGAISMVQPYMIRTDCTGGKRAGVRGVDKPAATIMSTNGLAVVEPFITEFHGDKGGKPRVKPVDDPLPTQTTEPRFGLAQPFLMSAGGPEVGPRSIEDPANTVLTRDHMAVVQPFIVGAGGPSGQGHPKPVTEPMGTVIGENHKAVVEPYLVHVNHGEKVPGESVERRVKPVTDPMPTVTAARRGMALAEPFLIQYNGTADAKSVDDPMGTLTSKPRFALVIVIKGQQYLLDIRFRMFTWRELAAAQGFPKDYKFTGNQGTIVKQIGNAVPVGLAQALCLSILGEPEDLLRLAA
jgi:DNA (cytosine-5)-methyltransferase 1